MQNRDDDREGLYGLPQDHEDLSNLGELDILFWVEEDSPIGAPGKYNPFRDAEWLHRMYWELGFSTNEIAVFTGESASTISRWIRDFDIETRGPATGEDHWAWRGGISCEPYDQRFADDFKEMIRQRQGRRCLVCRLPSRNGLHLCVHHIDYNKKNTVARNCCALCHSCHTATNSNREYWQGVLTKLPKRLIHEN